MRAHLRSVAPAAGAVFLVSFIGLAVTLFGVTLPALRAQWEQVAAPANVHPVTASTCSSGCGVDAPPSAPQCYAVVNSANTAAPLDCAGAIALEVLDANARAQAGRALPTPSSVPTSVSARIDAVYLDADPGGTVTLTPRGAHPPVDLFYVGVFGILTGVSLLVLLAWAAAEAVALCRELHQGQAQPSYKQVQETEAQDLQPHPFPNKAVHVTRTNGGGATPHFV